jgi:hypothetical protein
MTYVLDFFESIERRKVYLGSFLERFSENKQIRYTLEEMMQL